MFALCAMLLRINDIYFTNNVELHMAYHKLSSIKKMFPDLFWEENPAVRFLQANTSLHFGWSLMGGSTVLRDVYCSRYSSDSLFSSIESYVCLFLPEYCLAKPLSYRALCCPLFCQLSLHLASRQTPSKLVNAY